MMESIIEYKSGGLHTHYEHRKNTHPINTYASSGILTARHREEE